MRSPDPPRVGYILKRYPRYSETFIINEILAHESAGLAVEIFSLRPASDTHFPEQVERVRARVTYLPSEGKAAEFWAALEDAHESFAAFRSFLRLAKDEDALVGLQSLLIAYAARQRGLTHLHAHFATAATAAARLAAHLTGLPYSFTAHAKDIFHDDVRSDDLSCKLRDAAAVVTVSDYNCAHLRERFGRAAAGVRRVYNGLDIRNFPFAAPRDRTDRIVAVGRLVEKKGFADLVDACAILARRGRAFSCDIIGGGELSAALQSQINALGLGERVRLRGALPLSEVTHAVREAAVLAAPCVVGGDGNRDGLPTVLLEAMALGTPCVATPVTGIPEVVRDGQTGRLVPEHNPADLADALHQLLDAPQVRVRLATAARALIEANFDIHKNTARIRDLFHRGRALQEVG
jgi:glycosyltransferase involved in cell wall biosynthesis